MHGGTINVAKYGTQYRYYVCSLAGRPNADRWCGKFRADVIEPVVLRDIESVLGTPEVMAETRRRIVEKRMRGGTSETKRRSEILSSIAESERRASLAYEDRLAGYVSAAQFAQFNAKELDRQQQLRDELRRVEDALLALGGGLDVTQVFSQLGDIGKALDALTHAERRQLVGQVVASVRVTAYDRYHPDETQVEVTYRAPFCTVSTPEATDEEKLRSSQLARGA
jgi:hypothetical protein